MPDGTTSDGYLDDLESQVWINSRIAKRKYRLFNWAALFALAAIALLLIPAFILAYHAIIGVVYRA